jgi:hypothetical protein
MNKQILKITIAISLFLLINPKVLAIDVRNKIENKRLPPVAKSNLREEVASKRAELKVKSTTLKKDKANKEIDRRIESMNKMIEKINSIKRITEIQKTNLVSQVNAEIAKLTALKTKIQNDLEQATLTEDKKSIINSYRIYALFMPKMTIIAHADSILNLIDLMSAKNPTGEAAVKINDAKTLATGVISNVVNLTVDGYPANKTQLGLARQNLQKARLDLVSARPLMK